jgi:hypothetical protein
MTQEGGAQLRVTLLAAGFIIGEQAADRCRSGYSLGCHHAAQSAT